MANTTTKRSKFPVIDCDIHNSVPPGGLSPYLSERWQEHYKTFGLRSGGIGGYYPRALMHAARRDAWPPSGLSPGADLEFMQEQLLDAYDMEYGVLNPLMPVGEQLNIEFGAAMASAVNDWQVADWVEPEPRLRASIVVPYEDGDLAAEEIHRCGPNPAFVQILLIARTKDPLGNRKYWKIYEAASEYNLPIGIHFGGVAGPITGAGWPSYYIEDHGGMPQAFHTNVISYAIEGVFDHFPNLKIVLIEGGFAWMPPLIWRLDATWEKLKVEVPDLKRKPSEYIRDHFWLSTQPMEEPPKREYFEQLLEQMDMNDKLMFATDYPHWDFDSPERALPSYLKPELRRMILGENARKLYDFDKL
ncbi:MAG: amidohydrolase family protein [Candidatus Poribacteria bacterium]|nr:amidohydrolase family protein [Candidatus Poribacteria bacterium]